MAAGRAGPVEQTLDEYDKAIGLDSHYAEAHADRALAYFLLGNHAEAQRDVDRAVELGISRAALEQRLEELPSVELTSKFHPHSNSPGLARIFPRWRTMSP